MEIISMLLVAKRVKKVLALLKLTRKRRLHQYCFLSVLFKNNTDTKKLLSS